MTIENEVILKSVIDISSLQNIDLESVNWSKVVDILVEKKLMLFLYPKIKKYIVDEQMDSYERIYKNLYQVIDRQIDEIKNIQKKLSNCGIEAMFVKGVFLSKAAFNSLYARQCADIDILVNREDMVSAYNSVYELGYRFWTGNDENGEPLLSEKPDYLFSDDYHEFVCLKKGKGYNDNNNVIIEIKYATSAIPYKYIMDFQENFQIEDVDDVKIKTFDIPFTLIHICAHLYVNTQCEDGYLNDGMFRDLVDLKMFLYRHENIDWKFIYKKAKEYEIVHELYFALYSVNSVWPNTVSEEIVECFSPRNITYAYNGNEFGELHNWKIDIVTRCFDEKLRLKQYSELYKTDIFSDVNTPVIVSDGSMHPFLMEKDDIQIRLFISYDYANSCIKLITLFDLEMFKQENFYFFITVVDNDASQDLIERTISNHKKLCRTNLKGTWETYDYHKQGINFINIKTEEIFSSQCDKVYILIDTYKAIGEGGFRGTGVKEKYIICNTTK
ncbi:nucleotidyltransferase family protein [Anaerocolumna xylanovorans]|uniref:Uncharacterized nucleotidyltransferase n=1 Tax=Anaerocolumna xylanovorans DSM 12503 TaxID=1121345 RepID=A0A1M7XWH4_9FIRM|nr:nucleotidyltransferase family protein [Anaerocolumna xylanovorans]SHO43102.1 Uncharacterised nucleotidyltransferase [Anaerocolumna xylanovorans DSM 12503]